MIIPPPPHLLIGLCSVFAGGMVQLFVYDLSPAPFASSPGLGQVGWFLIMNVGIVPSQCLFLRQPLNVVPEAAA